MFIFNTGLLHLQGLGFYSFSGQSILLLALLFLFQNIHHVLKIEFLSKALVKIKSSTSLALPLYQLKHFLFWITSNKLQTPIPKKKVNTKDCQHNLEIIYLPKSLEHLQNLFFFLFFFHTEQIIY